LIGLLYNFDKKSGVFANNLIASGPGIMTTASYPQIKATDRLISIVGTSVKKRAIDGSDSAWVVESTLTAGPNYPIYQGRATVSRTTNPAVVCIIYPGGGILFYDVVAKQQVFKPIARIGANNGAWYSPKFDIYISYTTTDSDWQISVWANAVRPGSLSNPVAAPSLVQGKVSQVMVRLLGADDEPCVGELVSWAITGGLGSLTAAQSVTDADGYAHIGYISPLSAGSSPTIQASVEF
jgi:hypothetical protein